MSHVVDHITEAQLHAFLDRELEFADPDVRTAVGTHIADCSKCSALLKEVRGVHETSSHLLDVTAPPARPAPAFEEIVQRAAERRRSGLDTTIAGSSFLGADESARPGADEQGETLGGIGTTANQPDGREEVVPDEHDIIFIEPNQIAAQKTLPTAQPKVATRPKPSRRRGARWLALAATIVIGVGIGGWFGRPYVLERLSGPSPSMMASQTLEQEALEQAGKPTTAALSEVLQDRAGTETRLAADLAPPANVRSVEPDVADSSGGRVVTELQANREGVDDVSALTLRLQDATAGESGYTIVGSVRDAMSKRAIAGAQVVLVGTNQFARTDSMGRYEIAGVPAGSVNVDVLGVGYERGARVLRITENDGTVADFELRRSVVSLDEMRVAAEQPARAREAVVNAPAQTSESAWIQISRAEAESLLGGPLVTIDGFDIELIERAPDRVEIRLSQTTMTGEPVYLRIVSPGNVGENPMLETVEITSPDEQRPSTGVAKYGNYMIRADAMLSGVELQSLLRRITVAPDMN